MVMCAITAKKLDGVCGPREMPENLQKKKKTPHKIRSEPALYDRDEPTELSSWVNP